MWYRGYLALLLVTALGSVSCNEDDIIAAAAGDPVPTGMGVMASTATVAGASAVASAVSEAANASEKVSLKASGLPLGVFPEQNSINCDGGGSIGITGQAPGPMTATFSSCSDGPYTVSGSAAMSVDATRNCREDGADHDVPSDLTATFNGTVVIDGETVTFSNFGVAITNPTYNGAPDQAETGGTCSLLSGSIHATGTISTETAGETTTIDLGSTSIDVDFVDQQGATQLTMDGTLSVDTLCTDGALNLTFVTVSPLIVLDGDATPSSGILDVNNETVNFAESPSPIPCSGLL